jgi:predicted RNA binding protein with dsRBD fold (UPF0201 family)
MTPAELEQKVIEAVDSLVETASPHPTRTDYYIGRVTQKREAFLAALRELTKRVPE